ncbi:MAG: ROK family protein, partial [Magnetovibrio sp.]|nr:ROK family protein [Magnetovibrio sp.]
CYCGHHGCIETFLSGPGLSRDHEFHTKQRASGPSASGPSASGPRASGPRASGPRASGQDISVLDLHGNPAADATLKRYEHRLARAIATVINILDPDVIVLGGGLSNLKRLYTNVPKIWAPWIFSDTCTTRLVQNVHGDSSGVRGAAWLWD